MPAHRAVSSRGVSRARPPFSWTLSFCIQITKKAVSLMFGLVSRNKLRITMRNALISDHDAEKYLWVLCVREGPYNRETQSQY